MKNIIKLIEAIHCIVIVTIIGFFLISCGDAGAGGGGGGGSSAPAGTTFSAEGKFDSVKQFSIANAENYSRAAVTADSYAIKGELEYESKIYNLSGTYDPLTRNIAVSAASEEKRFSIIGAFDSSGAFQGGTVTVLSKSGDNWTAASFVVTEAPISFSAVTIEPEYNGGVPSTERGWWRFSQSFGDVRIDGKILLSEWDFLQDLVTTYNNSMEYASTKGSVIKVNGSGNTYDVIFGYPVYTGSKAQVEAAAADFLSKNSLSAEKLDKNPFPNIEDWSYWLVNDGASVTFRFPADRHNQLFSEWSAHEYAYRHSQERKEAVFVDYVIKQIGGGITKSDFTRLTDQKVNSTILEDLYKGGETWISTGVGISTEYWYYSTDERYNDGNYYCVFGTNNYINNNYYNFDEAGWAPVRDNPTVEEQKTLLAAFMTSKGGSPQMLAEAPYMPILSNSVIYYWYEVDINDVVFVVGSDVAAAQGEKVNRYYTTNHLQNYLIGKVSPSTKYSKMKVVTSGNSMTLTYYQGEYNNVSGAESTSTLDTENQLTLSR